MELTLRVSSSFGLSFIGRAFSEADLIGFAYAFEQRTQVRNKVQPYITANTELVNVVGRGVANFSSGATSRRDVLRRSLGFGGRVW